MTREEAIRIAQGLITNFKCESETMVEFCNVVIEALEQEPKNEVLDKIKENIQFIKDKCLPNTIAEEYGQKGLQEALDIIDKYKGESDGPLDFTDEIDRADTIIEAAKESYDNDGWCNTCEYKYLESECLGCAKYDEYDNLITLSNYKKENEDAGSEL